MKNGIAKRLLTSLLCVMLAAALVMGTVGCSKAPETSDNSAVVMQDGATLGNGATAFTFTVVNGEGVETTVTVKTDKETVGEALVELGLVSGEDSDWGLMVDTVNGETVNYNETGKYWAFYIDGEYAQTGVDSTPVTAGATYTFKVE
jgi:hypothetical protein